jgi:hypothetical protein
MKVKRFKAVMVAYLLAAVATVAVLSGCNTEALKDGYDFGDLSVSYCASTTPQQRDLFRTALQGVAASKGIPVGVDYCKAFGTLSDGYKIGDVTKVWCNAADPASREQIRTVFADQLKVSGVELSETYCQVAGYVLPSDPTPE